MNLREVRDKWASHISTPKHPLGEVKDVFFSFTHPSVDAHFQFAFFMLDILGDINTMFQTKHAFVMNFWGISGCFSPVSGRRIEETGRRRFWPFHVFVFSSC